MYLRNFSSISCRQQLSKFTRENESSSCEPESCEGKPREETSLSRRDIFPKDESKYATILAAGRERRSKFEELQAASKNLERRLHEDDDYRRRQEMERRLNKDKPPRCDKYPSFPSLLPLVIFNSQLHRLINLRDGCSSDHCVAFTYRYEDLEGIPQELDRRFHGEQRSLEQQQQHLITRSKYESDMERARSILQHNLRKERGGGGGGGGEKLEKLPKATQTNLPPPLSAICQSPVPKPMSVRQDSNVSSDSFSQTSSPSYTSKTMEAPLLPHKHGKVPGTFQFAKLHRAIVSLRNGCRWRRSH